MASLKTRHEFIASKLQDAFGVDAAEALAAVKKGLALLNDFLGVEAPGAGGAGAAPAAGGSSHVLAYYQPRDSKNEEGEWVVGTGKPECFFTHGDEEKLRNKAIFFIRTVDKVDLDKVRRRPPPFASCRLRCRRKHPRRRCSPVNALSPPRPAPPRPSPLSAGQRRAAALRRGGEGAAGATRGVAAGRVRQARGGAPRLGQGAERAA